MKIITSLVRNPTCDVEFQPDSDQDSSENPQIDVIKKISVRVIALCADGKMA